MRNLVSNKKKYQKSIIGSKVIEILLNGWSLLIVIAFAQNSQHGELNTTKNDIAWQKYFRFVQQKVYRTFRGEYYL